MSTSKADTTVVEENDLVSYVEEKLGHLKPYWTHITLGVCVAILALLGGIFVWQKGKEGEAAKYQGLSIAYGNYARSQDNTSLKEFADQNPDDPAGLWALLFAADAEMREGLGQLANDRDAGFAKISKAKDFYQQIVDSNTKKSPMFQRRSVYALAYACESNGDFDAAKDLYSQIVESGEENPLFAEAERGLNRVTSPDMIAFFKNFKEFVPAADEEAPGAALPQRPDISLPDVDQPDSGGGDFGEAGSEAKEDAPADAAADSGGEAAEATEAEGSEVKETENSDQ